MMRNVTATLSSGANMVLILSTFSFPSITKPEIFLSIKQVTDRNNLTRCLTSIESRGKFEWKYFDLLWIVCLSNRLYRHTTDLTIGEFWLTLL